LDDGAHPRLLIITPFALPPLSHREHMQRHRRWLGWQTAAGKQTSPAQPQQRCSQQLPLQLALQRRLPSWQQAAVQPGRCLSMARYRTSAS